MGHTLPFDNLLFVDDRQKNVLAARALGIEAILYGPGTEFDAAPRWLSTRLV
jgi:FMN phosphatase YigB (HAD superfamily)